MANNVRVMDSIRNFLLKMKALDTEIPEELAEDALEMTEEIRDALEEEELMEDGCEAEVEDEEEVEEKVEDEDIEEMVEKKVEDALVRVLRRNGLIQDRSMKSLDALEEELEEDEDVEEVASEKEVTEDPEVINAQDARMLLRRVKPVIAGVKDSRQRKILADSFAKALKLGKANTADYAAIYEATRSHAKDSASKAPQELGSEWAKKYNPHYKEEK